jgi:hypothetical protein
LLLFNLCRCECEEECDELEADDGDEWWLWCESERWLCTDCFFLALPLPLPLLLSGVLDELVNGS